MNAVDVATIEAQALSLGREDRGHLASVLLRSLDGENADDLLSDEETEQVWAVELDRRSREMDENPSIGISHEEVMRSARELLR